MIVVESEERAESLVYFLFECSSGLATALAQGGIAAPIKIDHTMTLIHMHMQSFQSSGGCDINPIIWDAVLIETSAESIPVLELQTICVSQVKVTTLIVNHRPSSFSSSSSANIKLLTPRSMRPRASQPPVSLEIESTTLLIFYRHPSPFCMHTALTPFSPSNV